VSDLAIGKIFMNGRSQAVRLPRQFRFDTDEVTIEKVGDAVLLRPRCEDGAAWVRRLKEHLGSSGGLDAVERDRRPPVDDIESLD
jgi:antitoxin VapB